MNPPLDHPDLALEQLTDDLFVAREEAVRYRALAHEAIEALHKEHAALERLRDSHHRLLHEYRRLCAYLLREAA